MSYAISSKPREDRVADEYLSYVNTEVGFKGLLAVVTVSTLSIQYPLVSQIVASILFAVLFFVAYEKGARYREEMHRYLPKHKGLFKQSLLVSKISIFLGSMCGLWLLAIGDLDVLLIAESILLSQ